MKKLRLLLITLCVSVLMGSMAVTAYAGGGEEWDGLAPVEPLPAETVDPGEGFTEDGNLVTRDLLYDKATNKQFITVQTSGGNTFYIVIDYDKPTDEDGEQYQTYFLNMVDEADLLAAMQAAGGELPECSCADKCAVGAINTDCTVCAVNMGDCQGKASEPAHEVEPESAPAPHATCEQQDIPAHECDSPASLPKDEKEIRQAVTRIRTLFAAEKELREEPDKTRENKPYKIKENKNIIIEGQLGTLRDIDNGIYPFTTSSSPLAGFGAVGAGIPPYEIKKIYTIVKAYSTCVGAGAFTTEISEKEAKELRDRGGEYGAKTD